MQLTDYGNLIHNTISDLCDDAQPIQNSMISFDRVGNCIARYRNMLSKMADDPDKYWCLRLDLVIDGITSDLYDSYWSRIVESVRTEFVQSQGINCVDEALDRLAQGTPNKAPGHLIRNHAESIISIDTPGVLEFVAKMMCIGTRDVNGVLFDHSVVKIQRNLKYWTAMTDETLRFTRWEFEEMDEQGFVLITDLLRVLADRFSQSSEHRHEDIARPTLSLLVAVIIIDYKRIFNTHVLFPPDVYGLFIKEIRESPFLKFNKNSTRAADKYRPLLKQQKNDEFWVVIGKVLVPAIENLVSKSHVMYVRTENEYAMYVRGGCAVHLEQKYGPHIPTSVDGLLSYIKTYNLPDTLVALHVGSPKEHDSIDPRIAGREGVYPGTNTQEELLKIADSISYAPVVMQTTHLTPVMTGDHDSEVIGLPTRIVKDACAMIYIDVVLAILYSKVELFATPNGAFVTQCHLPAASVRKIITLPGSRTIYRAPQYMYLNNPGEDFQENLQPLRDGSIGCPTHGEHNAKVFAALEFITKDSEDRAKPLTKFTAYRVSKPSNNPILMTSNKTPPLPAAREMLRMQGEEIIERLTEIPTIGIDFRGDDDAWVIGDMNLSFLLDTIDPITGDRAKNQAWPEIGETQPEYSQEEKDYLDFRQNDPIAQSMWYMLISGADNCLNCGKRFSRNMCFCKHCKIPVMPCPDVARRRAHTSKILIDKEFNGGDLPTIFDWVATTRAKHRGVNRMPRDNRAQWNAYYLAKREVWLQTNRVIALFGGFLELIPDELKELLDSRDIEAIKRRTTAEVAALCVLGCNPSNDSRMAVLYKRWRDVRGADEMSKDQDPTRKLDSDSFLYQMISKLKITKEFDNTEWNESIATGWRYTDREEMFQSNVAFTVQYTGIARAQLAQWANQANMGYDDRRKFPWYIKYQNIPRSGRVCRDPPYRVPWLKDKTDQYDSTHFLYGFPMVNMAAIMQLVAWGYRFDGLTNPCSYATQRLDQIQNRFNRMPQELLRIPGCPPFIGNPDRHADVLFTQINSDDNVPLTPNTPNPVISNVAKGKRWYYDKEHKNAGHRAVDHDDRRPADRARSRREESTYSFESSVSIEIVPEDEEPRRATQSNDAAGSNDVEVAMPPKTRRRLTSKPYKPSRPEPLEVTLERSEVQAIENEMSKLGSKLVFLQSIFLGQKEIGDRGLSHYRDRLTFNVPAKFKPASAFIELNGGGYVAVKGRLHDTADGSLETSSKYFQVNNVDPKTVPKACWVLYLKKHDHTFIDHCRLAVKGIVKWDALEGYTKDTILQKAVALLDAHGVNSFDNFENSEIIENACASAHTVGPAILCGEIPPRPSLAKLLARKPEEQWRTLNQSVQGMSLCTRELAYLEAEAADRWRIFIEFLLDSPPIVTELQPNETFKASWLGGKEFKSLTGFSENHYHEMLIERYHESMQRIAVNQKEIDSRDECLFSVAMTPIPANESQEAAEHLGFISRATPNKPGVAFRKSKRIPKKCFCTQCSTSMHTENLCASSIISTMKKTIQALALDNTVYTKENMRKILDRVAMCPSPPRPYATRPLAATTPIVPSQLGNINGDAIFERDWTAGCSIEDTDYIGVTFREMILNPVLPEYKTLTAVVQTMDFKPPDFSLAAPGVDPVSLVRSQRSCRLMQRSGAVWPVVKSTVRFALAKMEERSSRTSTLSARRRSL